MNRRATAGPPPPTTVPWSAGPILSRLRSAPTPVTGASVRIGAVLVALGILAPAAAAADLTPQEEQGKIIYLEGTSASGTEITALMGEAAIEVPAAALPCGSCHGEDGRGRPEGGVTPTDITWRALTKPYSTRGPGEREHPAYTPPLLKRAITMGIDPAGNQLHIAMPRYRMSLQDMADLLAYLQKLGHDLDPGLSADGLRIGTLLPPPGPMEPLGAAIEAILSAALSDLNARGGLYARRVELVSRALPADPQAREEALASFLKEGDVFALVSPFAAGSEDLLARLSQEHGVPVVGPLTLYPRLGFPLNRQIFYLLSGLPSQARVLARFATLHYDGDKPAAAILHPEDTALSEIAHAIQEQAAEDGWEHLARVSYPPGEFDPGAQATRLASSGVEVVFMADGADRAVALLAVGDRLGWRPEVFLPGALVGAALFEAPTRLTERLFLSFSTLPGDRSPEAMNSYRALAATHGLPRAFLTHQLAALASVQVLLEGLKRAGRDLSREKLIASLEALYDYSTGLTPFISYGPNRRVGARGAYVVRLEPGSPTLTPATDWIEAPEP